MNQEYLFTNKRDYYNATISGVGISAGYTLSSVIARPGIAEISPQGNEGAIHWKERVIEVDGVKHPIDNLKRNEGGPRSHTYMWVLDQKHWRLKYMSDSRTWKVWPANRDPLTETAAAEFKPYRSKTFGKSEAAELKIIEGSNASLRDGALGGFLKSGIFSNVSF